MRFTSSPSFISRSPGGFSRLKRRANWGVFSYSAWQNSTWWKLSVSDSTMLRIIIPLPSQEEDIRTTDNPWRAKSSGILLSEMKLSLLITLVGMGTISKGMMEKVSAKKVKSQTHCVPVLCLKYMCHLLGVFSQNAFFLRKFCQEESTAAICRSFCTVIVYCISWINLM